MRRWLPHIGLVLGLSIAIYALFFADTDEERIRSRLDQLEDVIVVTADDTNVMVRTARVKKEFVEIFVKEVTIEIPELTEVHTGRDELIGLAGNAPQLYRTASVSLGGLHIDVDKSKTSAVAYGEVTLNATRHNGEIESDTRIVSLRFDKVEDEWRIVSVNVSASGESAEP